MFGRKSRKIAALLDQLDDKIQTISRLDGENRRLKEAQVGLTADRDSARGSIESLNSDRKELRAERDQFAKRVEELEMKLSEKVISRDLLEPGRIQPGDEPEKEISQGDLDGIAG